MTISQTKYIDITSGVGGEATASRRELIGRVISKNTKIPVNGILEFNATNAANYFGNTAEAKFAAKYFAFISKSGIQADKISFARYTGASGVAPYIMSTKSFSSAVAFTQVEDGAFDLTVGDTTVNIDSLDFTSVTNMADVVTIINAALYASTLTNAVISFADGAFTLSSGVVANNSLIVASPASGTDILPLLGFDAESNPIISDGGVAETPAQCMARTTALSDNYGSFCFIDSLTEEEISDVAAWNSGKNVMFLYSVNVTSSNYSTIQEAIAGENGTGLTYDAFSAHAEFMPMALLATTAYNSGRPSTKNFMYQMFNSEKPSVTNDTLSTALDALKINYLGSTAQAGSSIAFYQDGVLQGDISDMGVYCNEIWLKDAIKTEFMNLLTGLEQLPANESGRGLARGCLQGVIDEALVNGVIIAGKELSRQQQAYITTLTGDVDAWRDVESLGYWLDVQITQYVENDVTKYKVNYLLVYSKGDSIRKVEGTDILI
jgi:hypothetical protein